MKWVLVLLAVLLLPLVSAANCTLDIQSKNTKQFLDEIPSINSKLQACPVELKSPTSTVFSSDLVLLRIIMSDGAREHVLFTIKKGFLTSVEKKEIANPSHLVTTDECTYSAILGAGSRSSAAAYAYTQKRLTLTSYGFVNFFKMLVVKPILSSAMKKAAVMTDLSCPKQDNGALCQHGGECISGNCVGEGSGPPWTYRCSCDPMKYMKDCAATKPPVDLPSTGRAAGQVCDHGGQCSSGNCVGVGMGPPWTYKCSCDPFKYVDTGC